MAHFFSKFKNELRTISASTQEQSLKFSIYEQIFAVNVVHKIAASVAQLANSVLLHLQSCNFYGRILKAN